MSGSAGGEPRLPRKQHAGAAASMRRRIGGDFTSRGGRPYMPKDECYGGGDGRGTEADLSGMRAGEPGAGRPAGIRADLRCLRRDAGGRARARGGSGDAGKGGAHRCAAAGGRFLGALVRAVPDDGAAIQRGREGAEGRGPAGQAQYRGASRGGKPLWHPRHPDAGGLSRRPRGGAAGRCDAGGGHRRLGPARGLRRHAAGGAVRRVRWSGNGRASGR